MDDPLQSDRAGDKPAKVDHLRGYAWNYFSFHAEQRMKTFHFYLITIAAICAGLVTLRTKGATGSTAIEALLCFSITFISAVFFILDRRNRDLVHNGENALRHLDDLEGHEKTTACPHPLELFARDKHITTSKPAIPSLHAHYSYTTVLSLMFFCIGLVGAICGLLRILL